MCFAGVPANPCIQHLQEFNLSSRLRSCTDDHLLYVPLELAAKPMRADSRANRPWRLSRASRISPTHRTNIILWVKRAGAHADVRQHTATTPHCGIENMLRRQCGITIGSPVVLHTLIDNLCCHLLQSTLISGSIHYYALTWDEVQWWVHLLMHGHGKPPVVALPAPVGIVEHLNYQQRQSQDDPQELLACTPRPAESSWREVQGRRYVHGEKLTTTAQHLYYQQR